MMMMMMLCNVKLWGWVGDGAEVVVTGKGQDWWAQGGDGYDVHGDGLGWGSVSVPMQTSNFK